MKTRSIVYLFACVTMLAIATSSWADGQRRANTLPNGQPTPTHKAKSANELLGCNGYIAPFPQPLLKALPAEACVVSESSVVTFISDENGNPFFGVAFKWGAVKYTTRNEKFVLVHRVGDISATRALLVGVKTRDGWQPRHELWGTSENPWVTLITDRASNNYALNGGDQDYVIIAGGNNPPGAQQPAPVQQAKVNCSGLNSVKRLACEAENNPDLGVAIGVDTKVLGK